MNLLTRLQELAPDSDAALSAILESFRGAPQTGHVYFAYVLAIGRLKPGDEAVSMALRRWLAERDVKERPGDTIWFDPYADPLDPYERSREADFKMCRLLETLAEAGPAARSSLAEVEKLSKDSEWRVQLAAAIAWLRIDPETRAPLTTLEVLLRHKDPNVRNRVIRALAQQGSRVKPLLPQLEKELRLEELIGGKRREMLEEAVRSIRAAR